MNRELEKLVDYAIVDGYITDKEKQVLIKKAQASGFDIDELEMILEGKLHEINRSSRPQINKCPSCGDIINGLSKVCPSCDYVLNSEPVTNTETLQDDIKRLEDSVYSLKAVPKPGASGIFNAVVLIIITGGLYIVYKKLIKKESLFDRYAPINERILAVTQMQTGSLQNKYGSDQNISNYINKLLTERDAIIKKRQLSDTISALAIFAVIGLAVYFISLIDIPAPSASKNDESAEEKTERNIKQGRISKSKLAVAAMEDSPEKDVFLVKIRDMEIDSLTAAGNYNEALLLARQIKNTDDISREMESKVDGIIEKQIEDLVKQKEFTKAKERAELASYPKNQYLLTTIKIEESVAKDAEDEAKAKIKASKKKRKK